MFVHGNPGTGADWQDLMSSVGEFARAVAPDMPGFGDADKPKDFDYTVPGYSRHLAGVLDATGRSTGPIWCCTTSAGGGV